MEPFCEQVVSQYIHKQKIAIWGKSLKIKTGQSVA